MPRSTEPTSAADVDPDVMAVDAVAPPPRRAFLVERVDVLAAIALGGAVGSLARWGLAEAVPHDHGDFAWNTLVTNVVGALLIGVLMVLVLEVWPPTRLVRPFLGVGVLGGFTTFSTYAVDTTDMMRAGHPVAAAAYLFGTLAAGLVAVWLAISVTRGAVERRRARRLSAHGTHDGGAS